MNNDLDYQRNRLLSNAVNCEEEASKESRPDRKEKLTKEAEYWYAEALKI